MPMYTFVCLECGEKTNKILPYIERMNKNMSPICPKCGGETKYVLDFCGDIKMKFMGY